MMNWFHDFVFLLFLFRFQNSLSLLSNAPAFIYCLVPVKYSHQSRNSCHRQWWRAQNHTECQIRKYCVYIVCWTLPFFMELKLTQDWRSVFSALHVLVPALCSWFILAAPAVRTDTCRCCWRFSLQQLNSSDQTSGQRVLIVGQSCAFMLGQSKELVCKLSECAALGGASTTA